MNHRPSGRKNNEMRKVFFETGVNKYAEGSCIIHFGDTKVLCTATIDERVPPFLRHSGSGWVTAEYGMLPRSTHDRIDREAARGKQSGRTQEIQRLIGRSLRSVVDLKGFGERQIKIDCDVIQADGGTRTASITGAYVAMYQAFEKLQRRGAIHVLPIKTEVAAVSCGLYNGVAVTDLDYAEDSSAQADMNFVMSGDGRIIEIQGTAEESPFDKAQMMEMYGLADDAIHQLVTLQRRMVSLNR